MAYELIESVTVGSGGAASIEFTSIPQDGTDLVLVYSIRLDYTGVAYPVYFVINGDTTTTYENLWLRGNGASVDAARNPVSVGAFTGQAPGSTATSNTFSNAFIYASNYTSADDKSISFDFVSENNGTTAYQMISTANYPTSSAITSVALVPLSSNAVQYSTASLYKITAA